jgi:hypothetical protein
MRRYRLFPRSRPTPWGVDNSDPRFPVIRDADSEAVLGGTPAYPLGKDDAELIVHAVNRFRPGKVG